MIDAGKAVLSGTPDQLKAAIGSRLDLVVGDPAELTATAQVLDGISAGVPETDELKRTVSIPIDDGSLSLTQTLRLLDQAGITVENIGIRRPTLDEVFLKVTGDAQQESGQLATGKGAPR